jgi:hypothetical protein
VSRVPRARTAFVHPSMIEHEFFGRRRGVWCLLIAIVEILSSGSTLSAPLVDGKAVKHVGCLTECRYDPAGLTLCDAIDLYLKITFFAPRRGYRQSTFRPRTLKFLPSSALKYSHQVSIPIVSGAAVVLSC